jgi:PKD repeat protein
VIGTRTDVDVFAFVSGGGAVSLTVSGAALKPNLDILAELRDANGNLVASSNPAASLSATISTTVAAGTYYLSVDGVGFGDPAVDGYSDYASLGEYHIKGTYPDPGAGPTPPMAPTAAFTATPSSGTAPLATSFDAGTSSDTDGTIVSYAWTFGDGGNATGVTASHTYTTAGTFTATLNVVDSQGLAGSTSKTISVSAALQPMSVDSITVSEASVKGGYQCTAAVAIKDGSGGPVGGAAVSGAWSGTVSGGGSGTTNSSGVATIKSGKTKRRGTCMYTVTGVTANGYTYQSSGNVTGSGSVSY